MSLHQEWKEFEQTQKLLKYLRESRAEFLEQTAHGVFSEDRMSAIRSAVRAEVYGELTNVIEEGTYGDD